MPGKTQSRERLLEPGEADALLFEAHAFAETVVAQRVEQRPLGRRQSLRLSGIAFVGRLAPPERAVGVQKARTDLVPGPR